MPSSVDIATPVLPLWIDLFMATTNELIHQRQPSMNSPIWKSQAELTARVIFEAADAFGELGEEGQEPYQWDAIGPALFEEYEYELLLLTLYACGWVCDDLPLDDFLPQVNRDVDGTVGKWGLPQLRLYLHTLMRGEKWCGGDSSVVLEAFESGALQTVARRLQEDESLFVPL